MGGDFGADDLFPMRQQAGDGKAPAFAGDADLLRQKLGSPFLRISPY